MLDPKEVVTNTSYPRTYVGGVVIKAETMVLCRNRSGPTIGQIKRMGNLNYHSPYKGSEVFKYPEIFSPVKCKNIRIGAIEIWVLKTLSKISQNDQAGIQVLKIWQWGSESNTRNEISSFQTLNFIGQRTIFGCPLFIIFKIIQLWNFLITDESSIKTQNICR